MIPDIDVRSLAAKKIYEGALEFEFEPEEDLLDIPFVSFSSSVQAKLHFEIFEDNSVEVKGTIGYSLKGGCSRCLEDTERRFSGEVDGLFVAGEGDGETYGYMHVIKLGELLRDSLLFALPSRLLCGSCQSAEEESYDKTLER